MKWRLTLRIATSPSERLLIKAAEWNPELSSKYRTNTAIGRPRKRWEDDINEFLKQVVEETGTLTESSNQINQTWISTAKDRGRWALLEDNCTMYQTSEVRQWSETERQRSGQHHITQIEKKIKVKSENEAFFLESRSGSAISSACISPKKLRKSEAAPQSRTV